MRRPLRFALASNQESVTGVPGETDPKEADFIMTQVVSSVIEAELDTKEQEIGIESLAFSIEEAVEENEDAADSVELLEDLSTDDAGNDVPVSDELVTLAEEHFKRIARNLGFDTSAVPAVEEYKYKGKAALRTSIEDWKERIQNGFKVVADAIMKLLDRIWNFIMSIVNYFNRIEQGIEKAKKVVQGLGNEPRTNQVEDPKFAKHFVLDANEKVGPGHFEILMDYQRSFFGGAEKITAGVKKIESGLTGIYGLSSKSIADNLQAMMLACGMFVTGGQSTGNVNMMRGNAAAKTPLFDGFVPGFEFDFTEMNSKAKASFSVTMEKKETGEKQGYHISNKSSLTKLLDAMHVFVKENKAFSEKIKAQKNAVSSLIKKGESLTEEGKRKLNLALLTGRINEAKKDKDVEGFIYFVVCMERIFPKLISQVSQFEVKLQNLNYSLCRTALQYVHQCVTVYNATEDEIHKTHYAGTTDSTTTKQLGFKPE